MPIRVTKGRARTPPCEAYPAWSEAKFWAFIRSALRAAWSKWPPKWEVLNEAKQPYGGADKRQKWEFKCKKCKKYYKAKDVSVDHITPAGSLSKWEDVAGFCQRLFVGPDKLQVLCKACHDKKTKQERSKA